MVPHLIGPPSHRFPFSLVPQLISPPSHWSPQLAPCITHSIGPPSHWSPRLIGPPSQWPPISLVPHLIGPPMRPWLHSSHWSPISLVPQCNPGYTILISPPSHWSPSRTLSTLFLLVPHLIGPPMRPWLHSSHWSISLVPQCDLGYTVLIDSPCHWSPNATQITVLIGSPSHWSPQCHPGNSVLTGSPSHWVPGSPIATLSTLFSLFPHLTGLPMQPFLFHSHYYTFFKHRSNCSHDWLAPTAKPKQCVWFGFESWAFVWLRHVRCEGWHFTRHLTMQFIHLQLIVCQCSI